MRTRGYVHETGNHQLHFTDAETGANTRSNNMYILSTRRRVTSQIRFKYTWCLMPPTYLNGS